MSDFNGLFCEIEREAQHEGPEAIGDLNEKRLKYRAIRLAMRERKSRGHTYEYDLATWEAGGCVGPPPIGEVREDQM